MQPCVSHGTFTRAVKWSYAKACLGLFTRLLALSQYTGTSEETIYYRTNTQIVCLIPLQQVGLPVDLLIYQTSYKQGSRQLANSMLKD